MPAAEPLLLFAALVTVVVGVAHSVLGERLILIRLFAQSDLPHLFGGPEFTKRTLRFAWHLTTVAWWGFAALLYLIAEQGISSRSVAVVVAATSLSSAVVTLAASRGRHLAWLAFLGIGIVAIYAAAV